MKFLPARHLLGSTVQFLAVVALAMAMVLVGGAASAQAAAEVVLLRASNGDALSRQGTTLLTAELRAMGFEVVEVDAEDAAARDLPREIERVSTRLQPVATFAFVPVVGGTTVELWLQDRLTGKLVIRRVEVTSGPGAAADLAVKAVELLRGSLLEVKVQHHAGPDPVAPPPSDVRRFVVAADRPNYFAERFGISAGATALRNLDLAAAYAPLLRISWGRPTGYLFRLTATGFGSSPTLYAVEGQAQTEQTVLLGEALRVFRPGARLQPFAGLAAGVQRVHSSGTGVSSLFPNYSGTTDAAVAGLTGGLGIRLASRLALVLDLDAFVSLPRTAVLIATRPPVGHTGGLAVLATATISATF
ncbi:MAG: hypothetical protein ABJA82_05130 [Myxococcales bacterium]